MFHFSCAHVDCWKEGFPDFNLLAFASLLSSTDDDSASVWRTARLHRLLVEHMLREGHYKTAAALAEQHKLRDLVDVDMFMRTQAIETALLEHHDCGPALAWCEENASRLKKNNSTFPYHLHEQIFIEVGCGRIVCGRHPTDPSSHNWPALSIALCSD